MMYIKLCIYYLLIMYGPTIGHTFGASGSSYHQLRFNYIDNVESNRDAHHQSSSNLFQKRQTGGQSDKSYATTTYKKTVTTQQDDQTPVETKYSWSTSTALDGSTQPKLPKQTQDNNNQQYSEEIIRRITTITEENVVDSKPVISKNPKSIIVTSSLPPPPPFSPVNEEIISSSISTSSFTVPPASVSDFVQPSSTCPANTYGNPINGCRKCSCNNNIDITDVDNCDSKTGKCLKCLYNTEGDNCDRCIAGFAGDATKQQCRQCLCNKLGTKSNAGVCNHITGQCPCLPNVAGLDCGKCQAHYYKFSSGKGCEACNCDQQGSLSLDCNDFDGMCQCKPGFGGRRCDQCADGTYGLDPKQRCQNCQCNREGSLSLICDNKTGACRCLQGIGGAKCDKCARGYIGRWPNCESCGECFEQWDKIIQAMRNETQALLDKVKLLIEIGTPGAYAKEFADIEMKLNRINEILDNQKLDPNVISELARQIADLSAKLKAIEKLLIDMERDAESTANRTHAVMNMLHEMERMAELLSLETDKLRESATQLQEANVDGAYAIILDSQNKSREAEKRARESKPILLDSEQKRRATENMLASAAAKYNSSSLQNEALLAQFAKRISELESNIPGINRQVCASNASINTCDQLCGGAGCNKCGGLSCSEGATTRASNALDLAQQAMAMIDQKYNLSRSLFDRLGDAKNLSEVALRQSKLVLTDCEISKSKFDKVAKDMGNIMEDIDKFAMLDGSKPAEIRVYGTECLQLQTSLKPEQILDLARKINETISSLTNIDKILKETAGDLNTAQQLHQQADRAKELADNILDIVEQVLNMLKLAAIEQARAAQAIASAQTELDGANNELNEISQQADYLVNIVHQLDEAVRKLRDRLDKLRQLYAQNELYVSQAQGAVQDATKLTDQAVKYTDELALKAKLAEEKLRNKAKHSGEMKDRAEKLKNDAYSLASDILIKLDLLREIDDTFDEYERRIKDYQDLIDDLHRQMDQYIKDIDLKAQFYRECQA